ncbi:MAG TPA: PBP1A family penicillin-binding protein [Longimicrobium sp.]|nr:PBP1A family penicillin-binding protein [Longimicrobium sp.]
MNRKIKIGLLAVLGLAVIAFGWLWFAPCGLGGCAPVSELEKYQTEGSQLMDVNGHAFASLGAGSRSTVRIDSLPRYLPQAFLAVEDRRFYQHGGVDWKRFGGALFKNVKSGGVEEGGSTITMQLARNLFPKALPYRERSLRRKVMEVRVARQIEKAFPKDKILELYLNHIYLGEGAYGVDAAAREYFGKPASRLSIAEAAVLGGLPVSPSRINPREDREAATRRRNIVLREMAKAGFITQEQAQAALAEPIRLARRGRSGPRVAGAWFIERVRRELGEVMGQVDATAGLRVFTTYDPVAQKAAEDEVARQAAAIESGGFGAFRHPTYASARGETDDGTTQYLQGAAIVMEAASGEVRALVGGRDYEDSPYDRVFQAVRQPGSAFKPFVYLTALENGTPPTQVFQDQPVTIQIDRGRTWTPKNYTGTYDGPITLRDALARSKNTVTVQVAQQVGMGEVIRTARDLGISTPINNVPATALGAAEVKPIELVRAFAAFDNGGALVTPHFVKRVEDGNGNVIWEAEPAQAKVMEPEAAFVLTSMLRDVVDRGTATPVRGAGFRGPAAGKTGTTNGATDVWFVGYTPELVASVWFGFDKPVTIVNNASGGSIAAPVWARIMNRIYQKRRMPAAWQPPGGVVTAQVDRRTGLAMDASCPGSGQAYTEYFIHSAPVRQSCYPAAPYPQVAGDSAWADEEAGAYAYQDTVGMTDLEARGVKWPELEAQRRRQAAGAPPPEPLPGSVEDPYTPPPPVGSGTVPPPSRTQTPRRRTPPPVTAPPAEPPVASGQDDGTSSGRPPKVLGEPVGGASGTGGSSGNSGGTGGGSSSGGGTTAPPDSTGTL